MNTNITTDWQGEEISLHAPPKKLAVPEPRKKMIQKATSAAPIHTHVDASAMDLQVEKSQEAIPAEGLSLESKNTDLQTVGALTEEKTQGNPLPAQGASFETTEQRDGIPSVAAESQKPQPLNVAFSQQPKPVVESDIKRAFMEALASPIPGDADQQLVQQVESARKILGVETYSSIPHSQQEAHPPVFDRSEDMKAAFTKALESPMPAMNITIDELKPTSAVNASVVESHFNKIEHSEKPKKQPKLPFKQKPQAAPESVPEILATVTPVVINPTGNPVVPEEKHSHSIRKFADKPTLQSGGWQADKAQKDDVLAVAPDQTPQKPFTIDETVTPPKTAQ